MPGQLISNTSLSISVFYCCDSGREHRPSREAISSEDAIALLRKGSGTHFDPRIVELFIQHLPKFEAEVDARGLADNIHTSTQSKLIAPAHEDGVPTQESATFTAYDKIRNAHREVYALYE